MHDHDSDTDDLDFAMLTPPTRPGPCKAATEPEMDPAERRLEREREVAPMTAGRPTRAEVETMPFAPLDRHFRWDVKRQTYWDAREFGIIIASRSDADRRPKV